jgi:hypothetical protein
MGSATAESMPIFYRDPKNRTASSLLIGYLVQNATAKRIPHLVLSLVASISFLLMADLDNPGRGVILVNLQNPISLSESLRAP